MSTPRSDGPQLMRRFAPGGSVWVRYPDDAWVEGVVSIIGTVFLSVLVQWKDPDTGEVAGRYSLQVRPGDAAPRNPELRGEDKPQS